MSEYEPAAPPAAGPGRMLSRLRGERGLSVNDVAQRLKYGVRQIEALEAEEFEKLPGATFVRGMVRSYAKLLDTDPQPVLDALDRQYVPGEIDLDLRDKGIPFARSGKRGTRTYLAMSVLVLIVAGVLYEWRAGALPWRGMMGSAPPRQETKVAPAAPAVALPSAPPVEPAPEAKAPGAVQSAATETEVPASPSSEGRIRLEFDGESWVEIRDHEGRMIMSQLNPAGSRKVVVGRPPFSLVIGNAAAVRLNYNDSVVDLKPHIEIEVARLTLR